jgi:hypothetical protein
MKKGVQFTKKRKFSFEKKQNSMKRLDIQRILSVRKMNKDEKDNKDINKQIDEYFFSPEKYFQKNSHVTVGKKIYLMDMNDPRLRRVNKLKTEKKMATNLFNNLSHLNSVMTLNKNENTLLNSSIFKGKKNPYLEMNSKFEIIDNKRLKMIFDSYKIKSQKDYSINDKSELGLNETYFTQNRKNDNVVNRYTNSYSSIDNMPKDIRQCLWIQNKKLNSQKLSEKNAMRMSRFLSKKINKPQNNLLLNRIDSFRFKKEVINEMEFDKPIEEQYGKNNWNISLRRPEHFKGVRDSYINLKGEGHMPFWSVVIERSPKQKELSIKPGCTLNNIEISEFKKQKTRTKSGIKNQYYRTVENLDDLSIEGKNLFNLEYKREIIDSNKNKILHKVFVENGKTISSLDVNNLYGNDTFYKDYNGYHTEKNK